ncbi:hypothetical protein CASFOL_037399 [Castilleja foliolosa]|uniref:Uncharacterized protein n=1 Tax=Castilleja foliolosa TaxID=1961234 RepID=A0ABD3BPV1_9LAMI
MDELRQSLAVAMEIEEIRVKAEEELKVRDFEIAQLKALLRAAIKERDEARQKACCQHALLQNQLQKKQKRHHLSAPHSGGSSSVDDAWDERSISSSSPRILPEHELPVTPKMPLPENGMLLQAVIKAGPLLQTLLIGGGPLPQWRHPPPPVDTFQILPPPVVMPRKREHQL